ncbi:head GIN domain-containing protein [Anaeromyxobacter sp. SG26]|uniref:head GIN domain-containing protein n=1 Tax=Anaeromyxobacter sp. SG26 TaxID=2925407 RepID=UPI001F5AC02F|nr:head GIN domain-containing protein [Anaeromyxobacter sp. SG26]
MRLALAAVAAVASLSAATPALARGRLDGDGNVTTEQRETGAFDRISLRGAVDAVVKVGPPRAVSVVVDSNLQPHVRARVEGSTLVVDTDDDVRPSREARVIVTVPELRALETRGSGEAVVDGGKGDLALDTTGSGEIRWRGEAARLEVTTRGSDEITLAGKAETLVGRTMGSGDIRARELTAHDADVRTSGSGAVELTLGGGALRARTSGSGDVTWHGEGRVEEAKSAGSGSISRGG